MKHTTQDRRERDPDPRTPTPPPTAAKPRNHPAHEVAMIGLALAQAGINCFLDEHEDLDDCQICDLPVLHHVMEGASRVLDWMTSSLESEALPVGSAVKRLQQELQGGIPCGAERLAQAIIQLMAPADEPPADEPAAVVATTAAEDTEQVKGTAAPLPVDVAFFYGLWDLQLACERLELEHTDRSEREDRCACDLCEQADHLTYLMQPAIDFFGGEGSSHCRDIDLDWRRERGIPFGTDLSPAEQVAARWESQGQAPAVVAELDAADLVEDEEDDEDADEEEATF
ncbi:MAG TPA: hypothetical protein VEL76_16410, partial [Gemmataceae bacterium]|nr:hypothetical protein [Gemmataceae bacterium]